jgi:hypothetical protein
MMGFGDCVLGLEELGLTSIANFVRSRMRDMKGGEALQG